MKLYYSPGACSLAPHIVATELGLKIETVGVNLKTHHFNKGSDFYKLNPKGSVPTIELDNGEILTEGAVIMQYMADQKPEANLIPKAGTWERYRCQEWLNYIATELHKTFGSLFHASTPEATKMVHENLAKKLDFVSNHLKSNQYLMGSQYTVADAYLFTILNWAPMVKFDLSKWHPVMGFVERMHTRPAVQTTLKAEGLLK